MPGSFFASSPCKQQLEQEYQQLNNNNNTY